MFQYLSLVSFQMSLGVCIHMRLEQNPIMTTYQTFINVVFSSKVGDDNFNTLSEYAICIIMHPISYPFFFILMIFKVCCYCCFIHFFVAGIRVYFFCICWLTLLFFWDKVGLFYFISSNSSFRHMRNGCEGRNWSSDHGGFGLLDFSSRTVSFLTQPWTTFSQLAAPIVVDSSYINH